MVPLTKKWAPLCSLQFHLFRAFSLQSFSSLPTLENLVKTAIEAKKYNQIPNILITPNESFQKFNPFSFLNTFPNHLKRQVIDKMLQSFISIRPRERPQIVYSCLLSFSLQNPNSLPITFAILQCILRSGVSPVPQTHISLSNAWLERRQKSESVSKILLEMKSIGYSPDIETCNYLIASLCAVDKMTESVNVLQGMSGAGCVPNLDSYDHVICKMCRARKIEDVFELVKKMVKKYDLSPREGTILKVVRAMRAKREIWRSVDIIEVLEKCDIPVDFEIYELVVEGCLHYHEYVLAGKVVMRMVAKGFIPYIKARQKVVEGLASVGELGFASAVRQKFVEFNS